MENKLNLVQTLTEGCKKGLANALNFICLGALYIITIWIPYLNIATTIGFYKAIIALSKGENVAPMSIFDNENFKSISDFFLLLGLQTAGIGAAAIFMFFPAIVLGLAWQYSMYFLIDKAVSPLKALRMSFDVTRGEKWTVFFVYMLLSLIISIAIVVITAIVGLLRVEWLTGLVSLILSILSIPAAIGVEAELYKYFSAKSEALNAPAEPAAE